MLFTKIKNMIRTYNLLIGVYITYQSSTYLYVFFLLGGVKLYSIAFKTKVQLIKLIWPKNQKSNWTDEIGSIFLIFLKLLNLIFVMSYIYVVI